MPPEMPAAQRSTCRFRAARRGRCFGLAWAEAVVRLAQSVPVAPFPNNRRSRRLFQVESDAGGVHMPTGDAVAFTGIAPPFSVTLGTFDARIRVRPKALGRPGRVVPPRPRLTRRPATTERVNQSSKSRTNSCSRIRRTRSPNRMSSTHRSSPFSRAAARRAARSSRVMLPRRPFFPRFPLVATCIL